MNGVVHSHGNANHNLAAVQLQRVASDNSARLPFVLAILREVVYEVRVPQWRSHHEDKLTGRMQRGRAGPPSVQEPTSASCSCAGLERPADGARHAGKLTFLSA